MWVELGKVINAFTRKPLKQIHLNKQKASILHRKSSVILSGLPNL